MFAQAYTLFGALAMLLAAIGLFGLMSYNVGRRSQEIGIRMALGATQSNILQLVLKQGSALLLIGIAFGLGAGLLLAAQLTQLLFRVRPWDPATIGSTLVVLAGAGLLACVVPGMRASSVDPLTALRRN
jgi:ABC-type antimicrobial peptide transport system permease subunit